MSGLFFFLFGGLILFFAFLTFTWEDYKILLAVMGFTFVVVVVVFFLMFWIRVLL